MLASVLGVGGSTSSQLGLSFSKVCLHGRNSPGCTAGLFFGSPASFLPSENQLSGAVEVGDKNVSGGKERVEMESPL